MKTIIVLATLALTILFLLPADTKVHATESPVESSCHLTSEIEGSIVIDYSGKRIFAPHSPHEFAVTSDINISAGTYDIYLEGYDGHEGRIAENQKEEQYKVILMGGGATVATTNPSGDVPDDKDDAFWSGKTDTSLTLSKNVDSLRIRHAHAGKQGKSNSLIPTCMMLVPEKEQEKKPIGAICGNGKKESPEECDDGNAAAGDGCSSSCSLERIIIDPVCGNGIAEAGEQCDDGNADENNCTSQCRFPEVQVEKEKCEAEIGNTVWNDRNANGIQDEGEEGITDVKLKLQYGDKVKTDRTNFRGRYKFEDLCADTYRVIVATETLDPSCYQTYDKDGTLDHTSRHKLDNDEEYTKADFGYHCPDSSSGGGRKSPDTGAGPFAAAAAAGSASIASWIAYRRMRDESATIIRF